MALSLLSQRITLDYGQFYLKFIWNTQRWKSRRAKETKKTIVDDDLDDSDDKDSILIGKGVETKTCVVGSMRTDLLLKVGLNLARNKIEEAFYESRIRVNARKVYKKSSQVFIGDEVDLIKGPSPTNASFLTVGRVEILSARGRDDNEGIEVKLRRSKSLIVENYPDGDPWKQGEVDSASTKR